jgi:acyl carrier protein
MPEQKLVPDVESIAQSIKALVADVAGQEPESIADSTGLDTLGIDSLLIVEVVVGIQRRFGVQVPPAEFRSDIRTAGQLCDVLGAFVHAQLSASEPVALAG